MHFSPEKFAFCRKTLLITGLIAAIFMNISCGRSRKNVVFWHSGGSFASFSSESMPSSFVHDLIVDEQDNLWAGTHSGLVRIGENGNRVITGDYYESGHGRLSLVKGNSKLPDNRVNSLALWRDQMAVATDGGVGIFSPRSPDGGWVVLGQEEGLPARYVQSLFHISGTLWIGSWGGGLTYFNSTSGKVIEVDPLKEEGKHLKHVSAMTGDAAVDTLWVAYHDQGIFQLHNGTWSLVSEDAPFDGQPVRALTAALGGFYAGTKEGLYFFDGLKWRELGQDFLDSRNILSLDWKDGVLAVGTDTGLSIYSKGSWQTWQDELKDVRVTCIVLTDKKIWAGTQNRGIIEIER